MCHRIHLAFLGLFLLMVIPLACTKTYYLGPLATTPTPVFTPTSTCPGRLVTTLAGSGAAGNTNGTGTTASFNFPVGVAVDTIGNVYVADTLNNLIRKISPGGVVSTLAGSGTAGHDDGIGTAATFKDPDGLAVDTVGNVYVSDMGNSLIREISPSGVVTTLAGGGPCCNTDGTGHAASFENPMGIAVGYSGNLYVADTGNCLIREINPGAAVTTLAGSGLPGGYADGMGTAATFSYPQGIAVDISGDVYVADTNNQMIRFIDGLTYTSPIAGIKGYTGAINGLGTTATFKYPYGIAVDSTRNIYVADTGNALIREIQPGGGIMVSTLAGSAGVTGSTNGNAACALFNQPNGIALDTAGNLYVADSGNNMIRKIAP